MKKIRHTINGQAATRRIKWYGPNAYKHNGDLICDLYMVVRINEAGKLEIAYSGSQIGIDQKGRTVLPNYRVVDTDAERTVSILAPAGFVVGKLKEETEAALKRFTQAMGDDPWYAPAGVMRETTKIIKEQFTPMAFNFGEHND
jgi:hypothetical protein